MLTSEIARVGTTIAKPVQELVQDLQCFTYSAVMIPAFMFADLGFLVLNAGNGEETTADQDFFINALYGTSHDDNVQVYYGANFAFGGAAAVTYGNRIYTSLHRSSRLARTPLRRDRVFQQSTKLLLHELTHVMQYKAFNGSHSALGWAYIKGYCNVRDATTRPFKLHHPSTPPPPYPFPTLSCGPR